jgi:uncharacterized repeat protein (TIGR01451 family)
MSLPAFGASMGGKFVRLRTLFAVVACVTAFTDVAAQSATATPPGTLLRNTAMIEFSRPGGGTETSFSNTVNATVEPLPTRSTISLLRATDPANSSQQSTAGPTACRVGSAYVPLSAPKVVPGGNVNPMQPISLVVTNSVHSGDAVFVQVTDGDQNRDAAAIDTLDLRVTSANGDNEVIRLSESGFDTGLFVGYIQTRTGAAAVGDCVLQVDHNSQITSSYVDPRDAQDTVNASALVDPYGLVFDSSTGQTVNGTVVRLIDAATGQLANVFGDDGVSRYPSTMTTGQPVTDSGGTVYSLPPGVFRFPLVAPGQYRLEVTPPLSHSFPSRRTIADLNQLPGGPFRLQPGSFRNNFSAVSPPAVAIDVPVDPSDARLFLQKTTVTTLAAPGDFVQYTLTVENTGNSGTYQDVRIDDQLPWGVRYRSGSTRIASQTGVDPTVSGDGRTLTFSVAQLGPQQRVVLTYVVEITQSARGPELVNSAHAVSGNGASSNNTQATIRLREDFFREQAIVVGRVVAGDCSQAPSELQGVPGVRIYLEDGRYVVTDDDGKYHFEGVNAGNHVVQMDAVSIPAGYEPQMCGDSVAHSGRAYSQFVDLRGGALWRADFRLAKRKPPQGSVRLQMSTTQVGEMELAHSITINVDGNAINNARLVAMLPNGLEFVPGSEQRDGEQKIEPINRDGVLTFALDALAPTGAHTVNFRSKVTPHAAGALAVQTYLLFDTPSAVKQVTAPTENRVLRGEMTYEKSSYRFSPQFDVLTAELKDQDRARLDKLANEWRGVRNLHVTAIGHTDSTQISAAHANNTKFKDNYELSRARAEVVAEYLRSRLNLTPEQLSIEGKGADQPLAAGNDAETLARNRRVEIFIDGMRVQSLGRISVTAARGEATPLVTEGAVPGLKVAVPSKIKDARVGDVDVESLQPGIAWLSPEEGAIPAISSVKVAVAHEATQNVELLINDAPVSRLNFDGLTVNHAKTVAVSRWIGIDLLDGENTLQAIVRDSDGKEVARLTRAVHFAGGAVRAEFVAEQSNLSADGQSNPVIALRMFDAADKPARPGTMGAFSIDAPYRSQWEVDAMHDNPLLAIGQRLPTFKVDDDGIARIALEPTTQSGNAQLRLRFNERRTQDLRVWLKPQARDWVMVGIAEGTGAYKTISQNMQAAHAAGIEEGYDQNGRVAFFAKGRIKGEYLLTAAFDSARERKPDPRRLLGTIEPDRYYTIYGDGAEQRFEAASQEKLFLKLERNQFMAMFGDFETGLTVTELSRYSRSLTGAKSDFSNERFNVSMFAAQSDQGFVKDELLGDGTSGLYRLSKGNLIANSDKVRIETRDRFRSEVIVDSRQMTRYIDYNIDYFNGTLYFKQPVPSRDQNFNPNFIIVEYEVAQGGNEQVIAGTRAAMKFLGDKVEVGASYLHEGAEIGATRLAGTDVRVKIGDHTTVRAEVARTDSDNAARIPTADAYFTELKHVSEHVDASIYLREQETQFGFGQQLSTETGTRKAGLDSRINFGEHWALRAEAFQQTMLNTDAERQMASAEIRRETERYGVGLGARHVSDAGLPSGDLVSDLASLNGHVNFLNDRVTLKGGHDRSLGGDAESIDYPARSMLGVDYKFSPATTLFSEYEHSDGAQIDTDMTRVGVRTAPWQRAQLTSSVNQQFSEFGPRLFANLGLTQGWQVNERWSLDFGVDQSKTVRGSELVSQANTTRNRNTPLASGSLTEDFFASNVAAMYRSIDWTFTSRIEHRDSDSEQRWNYVGGFYREAIRGHAFSLQANVLTSDAGLRGDQAAALVRMSWAFRPIDSEWIILDRLELKHDTRKDTLGMFESSRVVNNLNTNWQLDPHTQIGIQFGARYVISTFDGERYSGYSDLYGFDARRDLSERFDVGFHGAWLHSWSAGTSDATAGIDLGITVARNMWVSIGYNFTGFDDKDFAATRYTAQGPFVKFRMKVDQDTFKDLNTDSLRPSAARSGN